MEILNKRARFDYFIEEEIEAGIVLTGTEIKSVRDGKCNIVDCYGIIKNNEIFLLNLFSWRRTSSVLTSLMRKSLRNDAHKLPEPKVCALAWSSRAELRRIMAMPTWLGVAFCA